MAMAVTRKQLTFNLLFLGSVTWVFAELMRSSEGRTVMMLLGVICFAVYALQMLLLLGDWIAGKFRGH